MPSHLNISARPLVLAGLYARSRRLDIDTLARRAGLDLVQLDRPDAEISCAAFASFLELLAQVSGDPQFAVNCAEAMPARPTGVYQMIIYHSDTLRDAFRAMARFSALVTDAFSIAFNDANGSGSLTFSFANDQVAGQQFVSGQLAMIAVRTRQLLGRSAAPASVEFSFAEPAQSDRYRSVFGVQPIFGAQHNRITYRAEELRKQLPDSRQSMTRIGEAGPDPLHKSYGEHQLPVRVVQFIAGALQRGEANELEACRHLKIGRRSLQRELASAGTTFRQLLQEERARLARHYLTATDLSLTAISLLLGYSELSAFSRASKAWFGVSPSALRHASRASIRELGKVSA